MLDAPPTVTRSTTAPTGAVAGDIWINPANGRTYARTDKFWVQQIDAPTATPAVAPIVSVTPKHTMGPSPPLGAVPGDFWFDTTRGFLFSLYDDGNTVQWIVANPGKGSEVGPPGERGPMGPMLGTPPSRTIGEPAYTLAAGDNGLTLRFTSALPVTVSFPPGLALDFQCILFQAGDGAVSCIEQGTATIECGFDAEGSIHRTIDGRGFSVHVWCDVNPDGVTAHYWLQGVTRS